MITLAQSFVHFIHRFGIIFILSFSLMVHAQFDDELEVREVSRKLDNSLIEALKTAVKNKSERDIYKNSVDILAIDSNHLFALNSLALYHFRKRQKGLAKIIINRALEKHPNHPALHNNLGVIYLDEGEQRKAIKAFRKALKIKSSYKMAATNLSSIFLEYKDYSRALSPLEDSYSVQKEGLRQGSRYAVEIANNYAVALMGTGAHKKAQSVFENILEHNSRDIDVLTNYAILLVDLLKEKDEAIKIISKLKFIADTPKALKEVEKIEKRLKE